MDRKERRERSKARKAERVVRMDHRSKYYKKGAQPLAVRRYLIENEQSHMKRPVYDKVTEETTALMPEMQHLRNRRMVPSWTWDDSRAWMSDARALVGKKMEISIQTVDVGSGWGATYDQHQLQRYAQAVLKPRAFQKKRRSAQERIPVLEQSYDQMRAAQMAFSDQYAEMMDLPLPDIQFGP